MLKLVTLLRSVARVKGLEARAAEEELRELQEKYESTTANVGTSERDLLERVRERERGMEGGRGISIKEAKPNPHTLVEIMQHPPSSNTTLYPESL